MSASLVVLDPFQVIRPVGCRVLERMFSMPFPKLEVLSLGEAFQVKRETIRNIVLNSELQ